MPAYHLARSVHVNASPQRVFETLSDYQTWTTWSPWLLSEPDAKVTISSNSNSVGSTYAWVGDVTGQGELEHLRLVPGQSIEDELRFIKPFKSIAKTAFALHAEREGTQLTWTMDGSMPWFLFWMVPMIKTMVGMDYQRGLLMIKDWIESGEIPSQTIVHDVVDVGPIRMAGIANRCPVAEIGPSMERTFSEARRELAREGLPTDGSMISVYTKLRMSDGVFEYLGGFTLPENAVVERSSKLKEWSLAESRAFHVEHLGSYRHLGNAWSVANALTRHRKLKQQRCGAFEIYRNDPKQVPENQWKTDIYLPLR